MLLDLEQLNEEDRQLVAKAVLLGVTFEQNDRGYWHTSVGMSGRAVMYTAGRAAIKALCALDVVSVRVQDEYLKRTAKTGEQEHARSRMVRSSSGQGSERSTVASEPDQP